MNGGPRSGADADTEARVALWRAIRVAAEDVCGRFSVRSIRGVRAADVRRESDCPDACTWQLVEALSLLAVLLRAESATAESIALFGKTGTIAIQEDGVTRYLWSRQTLQGQSSGLQGRPDLIVTSTAEAPTSSNAIRIIEAKCVRALQTVTIRSEFGKAHDLRVATYLIWSFYRPSPRIVAGARGLGIDLEALGFDTEMRPELLRSSDALIGRVAHAQEQARRAQTFISTLEAAGREARQKLSG